MNDRLRQLRKTLGLTQLEFAEKVGMKQNTIATYEMGRGHPSDRAVRYICSIFHVNEEWLQNGVGDMFLPANRDEEVADFVAQTIAGHNGAFPRKVLQRLARMTPAEWALLERLSTGRMEGSPSA